MEWVAPPIKARDFGIWIYSFRYHFPEFSVFQILNIFPIFVRLTSLSHIFQVRGVSLKTTTSKVSPPPALVMRALVVDPAPLARPDPADTSLSFTPLQ
jgi:hypothetical protein